MHQPTPQQSQYLAWLLTRQARRGSIESLAGPLLDAQVDLNPHQVEAALFACKNPLERGVILADEVGLGKTIEAGLVILQHWAERKRRILIITPANLRKQWHQEIQEKFGLDSIILENKNHTALRKAGEDPFDQERPIICSYQFAKTKAADIKRIPWDLVVFDEAHRLRNVYKKGNIIAKTLQDALAHVGAKILLTATPLQNSLLELYGLVSIIDDRVFGSLDSFRIQYGGKAEKTALEHLRRRLLPLCKRTLRSQVQPYVPYTARRAIVQEFTPSDEERELSRLVADYLRRPNLQALPEGQRQQQHPRQNLFRAGSLGRSQKSLRATILGFPWDATNCHVAAATTTSTAKLPNTMGHLANEKPRINMVRIVSDYAVHNKKYSVHG